MGGVLSAFPYYGGKARMCRFISSMLEYGQTELYIEPYGGGARVLLNKPRHSEEVYGEYSYGLCTFFEVMADREKTEELIYMLLGSPPDRQQFNELAIRRMTFEDRLDTDTNAIVAAMAWELYRESGNAKFKELKGAARKADCEKIIQCLERVLDDGECLCHMGVPERERLSKYLGQYQDYWKIVSGTALKWKKAGEDFDREWKALKLDIPRRGTQLWNVYKEARWDLVDGPAMDEIQSYTDDMPKGKGAGGEDIPDLEVAYTIFQLYYGSRDGMGAVWNEGAGRDIRAYERAVRNLRNVSMRMEGVLVLNALAEPLIEAHRKNENAMMYLDPSYLKPGDEHVNLGISYKKWYGYDDHKRMLEMITSPGTRAKILISNYDVDLYNTYLYDWKKSYFNTHTSVGGVRGNKRTEVLWQNY